MPTTFRRRPSRTRCSDPVDLSLDLRQRPSPQVAALFLTSLLRSLLYQRGQIPVPMEVVERELAKEGGGGGEDREEDEVVPARKRLRLRAMRAKRKKLRERYLRSAAKFEVALSSLRGHLEEEVTKGGTISSVAFIFGATPISPREVFQVLLPPPLLLRHGGDSDGAADPSRLSRRLGIGLFRQMASHEALTERFSRPLGPTNVFVAVRKRSGSDRRCPPHLRPCGELCGAPGRRRREGARTNIVLRCRDDLEDGPEEEAFFLPSPVSMDLCEEDSPLAEGKKATASSPPRSSAGRRSSLMVETPCVGGSSPGRRSRSVSRAGSEEDLEGPVGKLALEEEDRDASQAWYIFTERLRGFRDPRARLKYNSQHVL